MRSASALIRNKGWLLKTNLLGSKSADSNQSKFLRIVVSSTNRRITSITKKVSTWVARVTRNNEQLGYYLMEK